MPEGSNKTSSPYMTTQCRDCDPEVCPAHVRDSCPFFFLTAQKSREEERSFAYAGISGHMC